MSHYFVNDESLPHREIDAGFTLFGREWPFLGDNGVFSKHGLDKGTRLLLETAAPLPLGKSILDVGCGAGAIGLLLAALDPSRRVTLSDVNPRALALAKRNAERIGVSSQATFVESDAFSAISDHFDTILTNPPIRAGKKTCQAIYQGALAHLLPGGRLLVVIRKEQGAPSALRHLEELFGKAERIAREKGYWVIEATRTKEQQ